MSKATNTVGYQPCWETISQLVSEAYVLAKAKGFRVRMKDSEYIRLHNVLTNTSSRTIWECLKNGEGTKQLLEEVPDEFYDWVKKTVADLEGDYRKIENEALEYYSDVCLMALNNEIGESRADIAAEFKLYKHPSILFNMLDDKDYSGYIWKHIKPQRELPFVGESDE